MNYTNFPVTAFGKLTQYSDTISRGRCRIFYRYGNRNGSYITPEFAEKLVKTLPYTPVKGIYDDVNGDYTDHGVLRTQGRIYGIVPGADEMNFAWEEHEDEDGVTREYACVDVLYYTALYEEASEITNKSQSMEIYGKSIKGDWKIIDGRKYYVFTEGSFLGLQVLGDDVEPCFEGAGFFKLYDSLKDLVQKFENYQENIQNNGEGGINVDNTEIIFKISDNQKLNYIWNLLNPNCNEQGGWAVDYSVCDVYDEYAIAFNYASGNYERIYYKKDDESDSLEITNKEVCYIVDVSEAEKEALKNLKIANNNTYEAVDTKFATIAELEEKNSENDIKINDLNTEIATLTTERDTTQASLSEANEQFAKATKEMEDIRNELTSMTEERDALASYKKNVEDTNKKAVIDNYADVLSEEVIAKFTEEMDNYSIEELDMKLTYAQKQANPDVFSKTSTPLHIPTGDLAIDKWRNILSK